MSEWQIIEEEFISYTGGTAQLISNGECKVHLWETPKDAQLFCDKLNAINEENEQLKNRLKNWHQRTFKAHEYFNILEKVIDEVCNEDISNQIWKEYEKEERLIE